MSGHDDDTRGAGDQQAAGDPFAPESVEASVAARLAPGAPDDREGAVVRTLVAAYALPPEAEAALARLGARFARGGAPVTPSDEPAIAFGTWDTPPGTPPGRPPRRRPGALETFLRTAAAVAAVALLAGGFYALLRLRAPTVAPGATPTPVPTATAAPAATTPPPPATPTPGGSTSVSTVFAAPIAVGGVVYAGAADGYLYAFDAASGKQLWRHYAGGTVSPPVVVNGVVYATSASGATGGAPGPCILFALQAATGNTIWQVSLLGASGAGMPLVANGVVYVGSGESFLGAYRAGDGTQLWTSGAFGGCFTGALAADANLLYVNTVACQGLVALHLGDGSLAWRAASTGGGAPAIADGAVWIGLCAFSTADGSSLGCAPGDDSGFGTDVASGGFVYAANAAAPSSWLYAVSASTRATVWQVGPQDHPQIFGVGNGAVYILDGTSALHAYRTSDGAPLWSAAVHAFASNLTPLPAALGDTLYVGTADGAVVALRASDGGQIWRAPAGA